MSHPETPVGRSEKLIPLVRKTFGDDMIISADSNGSYTAAQAIPIGKLMQEYKYAFYEEPVPFDWYEENKIVADALEIPIAGGEQEPSTHNFRWLIANGGLSIVQQDMFYFGGMVPLHAGRADGATRSASNAFRTSPPPAWAMCT